MFCNTEFLRVTTHQRVFRPPSTLEQATAFIGGIAEAPSCEVVRPGPGFLALLGATARQANAHGNLMFDAQIAALCLEHGIDTVLTNDRDFTRFQQLRVQPLD